MIKLIALFLSLIPAYSICAGQGGYTLSGRVVGQDHLPLQGASILLSPVGKGSTTNDSGRYEISGLPAGEYFLQVSHIGYGTFVDTISLKDDKVYSLTMPDFSFDLQEVVVTGDPIEARRREEALSMEIVDNQYVRQNLGGSLGRTLVRLPGITSIDIGSGHSKPVIRGLGFNRVMVLENGIKHEAQQWGADHGLEIDQYASERIEVIKGPSSLMYGSDAIGGIIHVQSRKIPKDSTIKGTIDLTGKSNNHFLGTSASVMGRKGRFFAGIRATVLDYGDYRVPVDSVDIYSYRAPLYKNHMRNTAGKEQNIHLTLGMVESRFHSRFFLSYVSSKTGFFANAHGLEPRNVDTTLHDKSNRDIHHPYQQVSHIKAINKSGYKWGAVLFESSLGFQKNFRQERSPYVNHGFMPARFPDTLPFAADLERQFEKYVYSTNLRASVELTEKAMVRLGVNGEYQDNRIDGRGFIIPAFQQLNAGAYAISRYNFSSHSRIQLGLRYDYGSISTKEHYDWFPTPVETTPDTVYQYLQRAENITRKFSNLIWSLGYNRELHNWSLRANLGKGFRMPIAKELAANGVNYHYFSYEVGDANLQPEISYQLDLGAEYSGKRLAAIASPFFNYFSNYIYLNPGWEHDRLYGNGNQIYHYRESSVLRYGMEAAIRYQLLRPLQLGITGEYVYSRQTTGDKAGFTLPFSPPATATLNLTYEQKTLAFVKNAYLFADYTLGAPQNNVVPPEEPTAGYQVVHMGLGGDVKINNQKASISLQINNILNNKYFNHTSYYRLINVPEPGRNVILNITIPFSGSLKKSPGKNHKQAGGNQ